MLCSALAVWIVAAQRPMITFESPGITAKAFCAELSRRTGTQYQAFDGVQDDLLAIRLTDEPVSEVLSALQSVERARITTNGAVNELRPDPVVRAADRAKILQARADRIKAAIEKWKTKLDIAAPYASLAAKTAGVIARYTHGGDVQGASIQTLEYGKELDLPPACGRADHYDARPDATRKRRRIAPIRLVDLANPCATSDPAGRR